MDQKPSLYQKGRYQLQYRGVECTNCGHPLDMSDRFCPNCSQANSTKKLTLKDFIDEFFSTLISYDSKLLKTLTALLVFPGKITTDYLAGKRVSYTNPFRFLLSLAIIYFLALNFSGNYQKLDKYGASNNGSWIQKKKDGGLKITFNNNKTKKEESEINAALDSLDIVAAIAQADSVILSNPKKHLIELNRKNSWQNFSGKREFFSLIFENDSIREYEALINKFEMPDTRTNRYAFRSAEGIERLKKQPGSFASSMISKLPFAVFFFLPVFTLFIWLIYIRKKYTYTDHLIFSFHIQSLLFILLIISFVIDAIFDVESSLVFIIIFGIYLFVAIKKFYHQGLFKTLLKFLFLNLAFFMLALFTLMIFLIGGAFIY